MPLLLLLAALLAVYNRRDFFGHWVTKAEPTNRPCQHACCRGLRAHPDNYPVTKRARWMRYQSDDQLAAYYGRHQGDTPRDEAARAQVLADMQRRDLQAETRERADERRRLRQSSRRIERGEAIEREWRQAEAATNGYMLNRRGREAGINERTLFRGPEARARKYASEELLTYWESHPRPTEAYLQGYGGAYGRPGTIPRGRVTSEEAAWRDRFEREQWEIEHPAA